VGTRAFHARGSLYAPKKKHIVPEFKEESLEWAEADKKHAQEERYARKRDQELLEKLLQVSDRVLQPRAPEKHYWVQVGDKDPILVEADTYDEFVNQVKELSPNHKSLKAKVTVEGEDFKLDFDEKLFKKYNEKRIYVEE